MDRIVTGGSAPQCVGKVDSAENSSQPYTWSIAKVNNVKHVGFLFSCVCLVSGRVDALSVQLLVTPSLRVAETSLFNPLAPPLLAFGSQMPLRRDLNRRSYS